MTTSSITNPNIKLFHDNYDPNYDPTITSGNLKIQLPTWTAKNHYQADKDKKKQKYVTMKQADASLDRVFSAFFKDKDNNGKNDAIGGNPSVSSLEKAPMESLILIATTLGIQTFSDTANSILKSQKIMTETQEVLRDKQVQKFQEQLQAAIEQADKARKAGIFGAALDWIIGAAEAIYGGLKVIEGAVRVAAGDASGLLDVASGTAYIGAGVAGMVKGGAEFAMANGADKAKCEAIIDVASKIQLGCEVFATAVDIFSAGRAAMAARGIAKGAKSAIQASASKITTAIESGIDEALTQVSKEIGEEVAKNVSPKLLEQFSSRFSKFASEEFIQKIVSTATKEACEKAMKEGGAKLIDKLSEKVYSTLRNKVMRSVMMAAVSPVYLFARYGSEAIKGTGAGLIKEQQAGLQKQIETLMLKQNFLGLCNDWYDQAKSDQAKSIKAIVDKEADSLDIATKAINQSGSLLANIASSIV